MKRMEPGSFQELTVAGKRQQAQSVAQKVPSEHQEARLYCESDWAPVQLAQGD